MILNAISIYRYIIEAKIVFRTKDKIEEDMVKNKKKTIEHYIKLLKEKNIDSKEAEDYFKKYINNEIILGELSNKIYEIIDKSKICE